MCKVVAFTNLSKMKNIQKLTSLIQHEVQKTEKDGFGLAIQSESGLYIEKALGKEFNTRPVPNYFPFAKKHREASGKIGKKLGAGIFHGRTSTNDLSLINTHPIQKNDWTLIHNGVVTNNGPKYSMKTTNDTEHLVHYLSTSGINELAKNLTGYYAAAAFCPSGKLHIFRDKIAPLHFCYVESIDSFIFATTELLIKNITKGMQLKHDSIQEMQDDTYIIFESGILTTQLEFMSLGYGQREASLASKSLGYELDSKTQEHDFSAYETTSNWTQYDSEYYDDQLDGHEITHPDYGRVSWREFEKMDQVNQNLCHIRKVG